MKSNESDFLELARRIYLDACLHCVAKVSKRDLLTIKSRVQKQGLSFLTIILPDFCADFEKALHLGRVDPTLFRYFRKSGAIPAFLQDMLSRIFDKETGRIKDENPQVHAPIIRSVRQICLAFKKTKLPCAPSRMRKALEGFVTIETDLNDLQFPESDTSKFKDVSFVLWSRTIIRMDLSTMSPKHGPGNTAERCSPNGKYRWKYWCDRLEPYFPLVGHGFPISIGSLNDRFEEFEQVKIAFSEEEPPSRVVQVPKTLKSPRTIAIEPACMQYVQQGIRDQLYQILESDPLTRGHINFADQSINQRLAVASSTDGRLATIDLKDASDRVPVELALSMFDSNPDVRDAIRACRSTKADLGDGRIVHLQKFASMGNALCFPVEAMYFYTICVMALLDWQNLPVSRGNIEKVAADVFVYGDDILVPADAAIVVFDYLQRFNCKVNERKTFYRGFFRESCGVDAYGGVEVTPIYITRPPPEGLQNSSEIISWIATANSLYKYGFANAASFMFKRVEDVIGKLPYLPEESGGLGKEHWGVNDKKVLRTSRRYQRREIRCWTAQPVYRSDPIDGFAALSKSLAKLAKELDPSRDVKPLERSVRHGAATLKRRWIPV